MNLLDLLIKLLAKIKLQLNIFWRNDKHQLVLDEHEIIQKYLDNIYQSINRHDPHKQPSKLEDLAIIQHNNYQSNNTPTTPTTHPPRSRSTSPPTPDNSTTTNCRHRDQIYGELHYYSIVKLLPHLELSATDHFLDLGSGYGKIVLQIYFTTNVQTVTGIEIDVAKFLQAEKAKQIINQTFPDLEKNRKINFICGDFTTQESSCFNSITVIYFCCSVFSVASLNVIQQIINTMSSVKKIIAFTQLSNLTNFNLTKKIFVHGDWDYTACYIYIKTNNC